MATRKPKKKAAPKKPSAKKAPAKKAAKKSAKKKAAKSTATAGAATKKKKKGAAKKASAKKAVPKKAAKKKAAKKKAAKKKAKAAPKKSAPKKAKTKTEAAATKASAKRPRPEREARRAKPDRPIREVDETELAEVEEADVIAIEEEDDEEFAMGSENGVATQRRRRPKTSLPPDHEILDPGPLRGEPVDKGTVIEAVRAAFKADEEHPVRGREFLGAHTPVDIPQEGDVDYSRAVEAQKAAREVLARAEMAGERQKTVDERIAEVYAREARDFSDE